MSRSIYLIFYILAMLTAAYICWPLMAPYMGEIKAALTSFKAYCQQSPLTSYMIYTASLACILLLGIPLSSPLMLMGGLTYDFWEATLLIVSCRIAVALLAFKLAHHYLLGGNKQLPMPRSVNKHPLLTLLLMRLAPLPDSAVNYGMATVPSLRSRPFVLVSLIGMLPITMAIVFAGHELGTISNLLSRFY